jgi:hypothetical protein
LFSGCALALLLVVGLGGCGGNSRTLDTAAVERAAAASILAEHGLRVTVHCPQDVPRRQGFMFFCTAQLEVGSYPLFVTETNGSGRVRYENRAPLATLDVGSVERAIRSSILRDRHIDAAVSCPQQVIQRAGVVFLCSARASGRVYGVRVTQTDGNGHVRYVGLS